MSDLSVNIVNSSPVFTANIAETGAVSAAAAAAASASDASDYADAASASASTATTQAGLASDSADAASGSAATASTKADESSASALAAAGSATSASGYATAASGSADDAAASALEASGYADDASGYASAASDSATAASGSASTASTKADEASASATSASGYADAASASATSASGFADAASSSATSASGSASTATTKAGEASASADAAAGSAASASGYADAASGSASDASGYADDSSGSALDSEAYAIGTRGGEAVDSEDVTYQNNAKYYMEQAAAIVGPDYILSSEKGAANGIAELDESGKVPSAQLPSFVDDVIEVADYVSLPGTGTSGLIYVTLDTNLCYRWSGSAYVEISPSLALGETSASAYRGDLGKTAYDHSQVTGNPHSSTASDVGAVPTTRTVNTKALSADITLSASDVGTSNKNLLHNWYFPNCVNQRGQTSYSNSWEYTVDMWRTVYDGAQLTVIDGGVTLSAGVNTSQLRQSLENDLPDGIYTLSVKLTSGVLASKTFLKSSLVYTLISSSGDFAGLGGFGIQTTNDLPLVFIYAFAGESVTIECAKLELGSASTLANDPPADFGEELRKCQRFYFQPANVDTTNAAGAFSGVAGNEMFISCGARFPVQMRVAPTVTILYVANYIASTTNLVDANISAGAVSADGFAYITDLDNGWTAGEPYYFKFTASADL